MKQGPKDEPQPAIADGSLERRFPAFFCDAYYRSQPEDRTDGEECLKD